MSCVFKSSLICLCLLGSMNGYAKQGDLTGTWVEVGEENSAQIPIHVFSLDITQANQSLKGQYCYVSNYGKRDDCNNAIQGRKIAENIYRVTFDSGFGGKQGVAMLSFKDHKIKWQLIQPPKRGDYSIPQTSLLHRGS